MTFSLIAAIARDGAIGTMGGLPWPRLRGDMAWFRALTMSPDPEGTARSIITAQSLGIACTVPSCEGNAVIMGKITWWQSLPACGLPGRCPIVLSRLTEDDRLEGVKTALDRCGGQLARRATSLDDALQMARAAQAPHIFICGGAQVYAAALQHPDLGTLFLTDIDQCYPDTDTLWPAIWLPDDADPEQRVTKVQPDGTLRHWQRTHVGAWMQEPDRPRYRFGIWERTSP